MKDITRIDIGMESDDQTTYLQAVVAFERKSIEVSCAEKSLNKLKEELGQLSEAKDKLRRRVIGDEPHHQQQDSSKHRGRSF